MKKKILSVFTSLIFTLMTFSQLSSYGVYSNTNEFVLEYIYNDNRIDITIGIDGDVSIAGFEASLSFDSNRYTIEKCVSLSENLFVNPIQSTGEIFFSMAAGSVITDNIDLTEISFICNAKAEKSDFSFSITDAYDLDELFDSKDVGYSIKSILKGFGNSNESTTTSVTVNTETTTNHTSLTTTTAATSVTDKNNFYVQTDYDEDENVVYLLFLVEGEVGFYTAEGKIQIEGLGLGVPEIIANSADTLAQYKDGAIYFSIISSNGKNIKEKQEFIKLKIPVEDENYKIGCYAVIDDICDDKFDNVEYSVQKRNNISSSVASTETSSTSTTSVTTTSSTITTNKETTSASTTEKSTTTTTETTPITTESASVKFGDINLDGTIDASDASAVLTYYAKSSTGYDGSLEDFMSEENPDIDSVLFTETIVYGKFGDVNSDGTVDASDASAILTYYAKSSTGYEGTLEEFMKSVTV